VVLVVMSTVGCQHDDHPKGGPDPSPGPDLSSADLWLSFEGEDVAPDGSQVFADAAGGSSEGTVVAANGGEVQRVAGPDGGSAVAFPPKCDQDAGCPRAMVEVAPAPTLDPGDRDFEFGATVWLAPDQTTTGSNIVQRGRFGTEGGQWKLQVDNDEGHPSCVVRGDAPGAQPVVVRSKVTISDSAWHRVVCRRDADGVTIEVDGKPDQRDGETGSVTSDWPIRIGAPGVGEGDDQFHGRIDDVYLLIAPES
jgi:hypothetical protein